MIFSLVTFFVLPHLEKKTFIHSTGHLSYWNSMKFTPGKMYAIHYKSHRGVLYSFIAMYLHSDSMFYYFLEKNQEINISKNNNAWEYAEINDYDDLTNVCY